MHTTNPLINQLGLWLGLLLGTYTLSHAQGVGINDQNHPPDSSAMLDVSSTTKGVLIPRMTSQERQAIPNPANSLLVFDTETNSFWFYKATTWTELNSPADDLGNHTATTNLQTAGHYISNDGDNEGISIDTNGRVGIGTNTPARELHIYAKAPTARFESTDNGRYIDLNPASSSIDLYNANFNLNRFSSRNIILAAGGGNVGIGLGSGAVPSEKLHIGGSITIADGTQQNGHVLTSDVNGKGTWTDPSTLGMGNHTASANVKLQGNWLSGDGDNEGIYIANDGKVAIGTSTFGDALVNITGWRQDRVIGRYFNRSSSNIRSGVIQEQVSLHANGAIAGSVIYAHSDRRIKTDLSTSNAKEDLATLMNIQVTDYSFVDQVAKGDRKEKKVIAQELKAVYPQAVSDHMTQVVPDIMQLAPAQAGWVRLENHTLKVGELVRLVHATGAAEFEVLGIKENAFQVAFEGAEQVLVYGRQVHDFHTVDYDAVAMLNVSATQAQQQLIEAQAAKIKQLEDQLAAEQANAQAQTTQLEQLQASQTQLQNQLNEVKALLQMSASK